MFTLYSYFHYRIVVFLFCFISCTRFDQIQIIFRQIYLRPLQVLLGHSDHGSKGNEGVLHFPPISPELQPQPNTLSFELYVGRLFWGGLHTYIYWIHTDAMITDARIKDAGRKTQKDVFRKIFTSPFIARVRKGCSRVCM